MGGSIRRRIYSHKFRRVLTQKLSMHAYPSTHFGSNIISAQDSPGAVITLGKEECIQLQPETEFFVP